MAKVRDLNPAGNSCGDSLYEEYKNLLLNAITIEGVDYPEEHFIKNSLVENGSVGYDSLLNKWAFVYGAGIDELGNPTLLDFHLQNGRNYQRKASYKPAPTGAYRIKATPTGLAMATVIKETTQFIKECNIAITQNMEACKTPYIIACKDKDILLSIEHAVEQKQHGQAVLIINPDLAECIKSVNVGVDFLADKFITIRDAERDRLLNKLGIMSANINKRERVQVGEVNATVGQCTDYIYLLIDTFNKQCISYGLPFKMKLNGSLEELYTSDTNIEENEVLENV